MLIETIKSDSLQARKTKSQSSDLLITLYAEASKIGKDSGNRLPTDIETISVVKKFIEGVKETFKHGGSKEKHDFELSVLETYLPTQLTYDELHSIISSFIEEASPSNMGIVMSFLKSNYTGQYDGAVASKIVKELV